MPFSKLFSLFCTTVSCTSVSETRDLLFDFFASCRPLRFGVITLSVPLDRPRNVADEELLKLPVAESFAKMLSAQLLVSTIILVLYTVASVLLLATGAEAS